MRYKIGIVLIVLLAMSVGGMIGVLVHPLFLSCILSFLAGLAIGAVGFPLNEAVNGRPSRV